MAFPDVALLLIGYLSPVVAPVLVRTEVPDPRPVELLQVRRVGGRAIEPVRDLARINFRVWAASEPRAMAILLEVRTAMWALFGTTLLDPGVPVYDVGEFTGPQMVSDDLTDTPQAFMTFEIVVRADDVIRPGPSITP